MSTERNGYIPTWPVPVKRSPGDGGSSGIEKDYGIITPGGGGGSAPAYTPIFYVPII